MEVKTQARWSNTIGKHQATPKKMYFPESLADLQTIVREAESQKIGIRGFGSGHSYSRVAVSNDIMVSFKHLNGYQVFDQPTTERKFHPHLRHQRYVEVGAGLTIQKMNKLLTRDELALTNMGAIDEQTVAGAVSTCTHGSGVTLPSFPGQVRSLVVVVRGGLALRVEPTNGLYRPEAYQEAGVQLIQDDDLFYSMVVSFGAIGLIYSLVVEVEPLYYLKEVKSLTTWGAIKAKLADPTYLQQHRSITILMNPYPLDGDKNLAPNRGDDRTCLEVVNDKINPNSGTWNWNLLFRNLVSWISGNFPIPILYYFNKRQIRNHPERTPRSVETSLEHLKDRGYVDAAPRVLYQGFEPLKKRAYDCSFAFPLSSNYVEIMEKVMDLTVDYALGRINGQATYQNSPNSFRFVAPSAAFLSPEYGNEPVVYIDTPFFMIQPGADEMLEAYQNLMLNAGGRMHWGKWNTALEKRMAANSNFIANQYEKFTVWRQIMAQYGINPQIGNDFTRSTGLNTPPSVV